MENIFVIHGSFGSPYVNWFEWLEKTISNDKRQVYVPHFPVGVGVQNYTNWSNILMCYLNAGLINENTVIIAHSIGPVFICKFLFEHNIKIKRLISVCGFNNYLGISDEYDAVNKSMFFNNLENVKELVNDIICFYSDNDPYICYESEKSFASSIATKEIVIKNGGHINGESGYKTFEDVIKYI